MLTSLFTHWGYDNDGIALSQSYGILRKKCLLFEALVKEFMVVCHSVHEQVEVCLYGPGLYEAMTWEGAR